MKPANKISLLLTLFVLPLLIHAQKNDLPKLVCPFENGSGREPKEAFSWDPRDEKVIMVSQVDSLVRSSVNGTVSNVNATEDNRYEIVIYYKKYYFWYDGIAKPLVKKGQTVTAGQSIGTYNLGSELEFRMYKDEDQMDPRELLECKIPRAGD